MPTGLGWPWRIIGTTSQFMIRSKPAEFRPQHFGRVGLFDNIAHLDLRHGCQWMIVKTRWGVRLQLEPADLVVRDSGQRQL